MLRHAAVHGMLGYLPARKAAAGSATRALAVQGAPDRIRATEAAGLAATDVTTGAEEVERAASLFGSKGASG